MKINLNIAEDKELRDEVKKIVKGQVTAIVRDEIKTMIIEALEGESSKKLTPDGIWKVAVNEIKTRINSVVKGDGWQSDKGLKDEIARQTNAVVKEIVSKKQEEIEAQAQKATDIDLKSLVTQIVKSEIKKQFAKLG